MGAHAGGFHQANALFDVCEFSEFPANIPVMSLIIGGVIGSSVVLIGDSATGTKVVHMPSLNILVGWVGDFNKALDWLACSGSAEYFNPSIGAQDFDESAKLLIEHVNSLDHMHGDGKQAAILVAGHQKGQPKTGIFETWGGKGSWPIAPSALPEKFMVGCLAPFGLKSLTASLPEKVTSIDQIRRVASEKIKDASDWLKANNQQPCIALPEVLIDLPAPAGNAPASPAP